MNPRTSTTPAPAVVVGIKRLLLLTAMRRRTTVAIKQKHAMPCKKRKKIGEGAKPDGRIQQQHRQQRSGASSSALHNMVRQEADKNLGDGKIGSRCRRRERGKSMLHIRRRTLRSILQKLFLSPLPLFAPSASVLCLSCILLSSRKDRKVKEGVRSECCVSSTGSQ